MNIADRKFILDCKLKTILKFIKLSWKNTDKIQEIIKVINSNNEYLKQSVINKYKKYEKN